jgi:hypothetical protein
MGTEFLILFIPVPFLFWAWDLRRFTKPEHRRKSALLLPLGIAYMAYFLLPITTKQYFMQGFVIGSFFYAPFYLLAWLVITLLLRFVPHERAKSN